MAWRNKRTSAEKLVELQKQMAAELQGVVPGVVDAPALASAVVAAGPEPSEEDKDRLAVADADAAAAALAAGEAASTVRGTSPRARKQRRPKSEYRPTGQSPHMSRRSSNLHMVSVCKRPSPHPTHPPHNLHPL
jgi:hypothetical protein